MQIDIVAVGRMKAGPEQDLYRRYADRFGKAGKALHLKGPVLTEIAESRARDVAERKSEEAALMQAKFPGGARLVLLDEKGDDLSSRAFSRLIVKEQDDGVANLVFAIGGPDGNGEAMTEAAAKTIRFGAWTWPHQIARILLVEQLYRAATILSGHPYHRI